MSSGEESGRAISPRGRNGLRYTGPLSHETSLNQTLLKYSRCDLWRSSKGGFLFFIPQIIPSNGSEKEKKNVKSGESKENVSKKGTENAVRQLLNLNHYYNLSQFTKIFLV
jgi:hypothetical protein